jgi:hypothetical protein
MRHFIPFHPGPFLDGHNFNRPKSHTLLLFTSGNILLRNFTAIIRVCGYIYFKKLLFTGLL